MYVETQNFLLLTIIYQWKRAVEFMDKYASKVPDPTESLYTIVMDVCEGANQPSEVVNTFKKMINRKIKGTKVLFIYY